MKRSLLLGSLLLMLATSSLAMTTDEAKMVTDAAARGSASAQVLLAVMYKNGDGGYSKNEQQAVYWYEKAAEQGNPYAQMALG
ncbi:MAG: SEL1-like repeat protein, partial [Sulfuriferula sp.]